MEIKMDVLNIVRHGLEYAKTDYLQIAALEKFDVKPKEDQIKSALYRSFSEHNYLVHIEASYTRNGGRCDLVASKNGKKIAIEIKTAWAGSGWVNKPNEQAESWLKDVRKLMTLQADDSVKAGLFIICFAYEHNSKGEVQLRQKINEVIQAIKPELEPFEIATWNGLNNIQFFVYQVFGNELDF